MDQNEDLAARVARLSERQKAILRLVHAHRQSKEIARDLVIGRRTVDKHIAAAMLHLGATSRRDAALMLARAEGERRSTEPGPLFDPPATRSPLTPDTGERWTGTIEFAETQTPFGHHGLDTKPQRRFPLLGGDAHDLTTRQRIGWMMALPFLIAFALGFFLIGFSALSELGRAINRLFT